jgi:hypothetical protein
LASKDDRYALLQAVILPTQALRPYAVEKKWIVGAHFDGFAFLGFGFTISAAVTARRVSPAFNSARRATQDGRGAVAFGLSVSVNPLWESSYRRW